MEKPMSLVARMKQNALAQKREAFKEKQADMNTKTCPNCGAGRAKEDGITRCAYCGFEFIGCKLTDGIHITDNDNSK